MQYKLIAKISKKIFKYKKTTEEIDFLQFMKFVFSNIKGTHLARHTFDVADIALAIGQKMCLTKLEESMLYWAGVLHDLGKVHLPDEIILSPHKLTDIEYNIVKLHPRISLEIVSEIPIFIKKFKINGNEFSIADIIYYHHERIDGQGYEGLLGENIPKLARILAVADAYAAMTDGARRFNRSRSIEINDVLERMARDKGKQFDPEVLSHFINLSKSNQGKCTPDFSNVNEIFIQSGSSNPSITLKELFNFIEAFIDKKRTLDLVINGDHYHIMEIAEPYIISQMPDLALIQIFKNDQEVAVLTRDKKNMLMNESCIWRELNLSQNDLKKAARFMDIKSGNYFFTQIHCLPGDFQKVVNNFGSFSADELRVFLEDYLPFSENVQDIMDNILNKLIKSKIIEEINNNIYSIKNVNPAKLYELNFDHILIKELSEFLEKNYIVEVDQKRKKIFDKWLQIRKSAVNILENNISEDLLNKILPFIDYIPKVNFRGVPLSKLKFTIDGFSKSKRVLRDYNGKIVDALNLYYFIEIVTLLDKYFHNLGGKDTEHNIKKIYDTSIQMFEMFPVLKKQIQVIFSKFDYDKKRYFINKNKKIGILINIINDFIGTNGNLVYIQEKYAKFKEINHFFSWLKKNQFLINPKMKDIVLNIKN